MTPASKFFAIATFLVLLGIGPGANAKPAKSAMLPDFADLVEKVGPSVVNIATEHNAEHGDPQAQLDLEGLPPEFQDLLRRFLEQHRNGGSPQRPPEVPDFDSRSLGSGFIISKDGYIVTNYHVVDGADRIIVRLFDRRELDAEVIGADERSDTALIKIDADDLPVAKMGRSADLRVGEWVMAIGTPFGFDRSATVGIVSALGRNLPSGSYVPFIQTDVAINPGNSGGPLFNLDGEVVGVNSQIYSRTGGYMGLSFAIPIDLAKDSVKQLRTHGRVSRGYLGVLIQDVSRDLAESFGMAKPEGALVARVLPNGPAGQAGVRVGDIIVAFNGQTVVDSAALPPMVGRTAIGSRSRVKLIRDGKPITLTIELGQLPDSPDAAIGQRGPVPGDRLGLRVEPLDAEQGRGMDANSGGVLVTRVTPDGAAARAQIQAGDIILMLANQPITDIDQFDRIAAELPPGRMVPVLVRRQGQSEPEFLAMRIPN